MWKSAVLTKKVGVFEKLKSFLLNSHTIPTLMIVTFCAGNCTIPTWDVWTVLLLSFDYYHFHHIIWSHGVRLVIVEKTTYWQYFLLYSSAKYLLKVTANLLLSWSICNKMTQEELEIEYLLKMTYFAISWHHIFFYFSNLNSKHFQKRKVLTVENVMGEKCKKCCCRGWWWLP